MGKFWFLSIGVILLTILMSNNPALSDIIISPDTLYQDTPLVITYQGFTNGKLINLSIEASYVPGSSPTPGLKQSYLVYPFRLDNGQILAYNGSLSVNNVPVESGLYSGLKPGMVSLSVLGATNNTGNHTTILFRVIGTKTSGEENGSITFLPDLSPKQGNLTVSISIGDQSIEKNVAYDLSVATVSSEQEVMSATGGVGNISYRYMPLNSSKIKEEIAEDILIPRSSDATEPVHSQSVSLLSYVPYIASERDQGNCGNCWAWASTGTIEVAHAVQDGIRDRLSIQFLNSNLYNGTGDDWACNGGSASQFAEFYSNSSYNHTIPWSNTNASYADANACPSGDCSGGTKMPASYISNNPNYPIASIESSMVSTQDVNQAQAILNLETLLDQNKALYYGFTLPNSTAWSSFSTFWGQQNEMALWNPDPYNGIAVGSGGGGHGVLLVGYNNTSQNEDERYWEVLNSWGNSTLRPNGIFRLKMNMNYAGSNTEYYNHRFYTLNVTYTNSTAWYFINSSTGTGGTISPSGIVQVVKGSNQTFSISPNAGFSIKDVLKDNSSIGAVSSYTFSNVTANHTIHAQFNSTGGLTHNITATAGDGGSINPSGVVTVNHGADQTFNITSHLGMVVNTILVDNVSQGAIRSYTFPNVTDDHTIAASFKVLYPQRWYIDATAGAGGTIEPSGLVPVFDQYNQSFTITALQDYSISDIIINDSVNLGAQASPFVYNFMNVGSNQSIHAQFSQVPDSYVINSSSNRWSKIIPSGSNSYPAYSNQSFVMEARPGSTLTNLSVNDTFYDHPVGNWTFTNLTKDYSIRVNGTPIPGQIFVFFDASPRRGPAPLTVQFSDQSIGSPTSFFWQFGDGATNSTQNPSHMYTDPGIYSVTLRANNDQNGGYGMWNKFITVTNGVEPEPTPTPVPGRITASFDVSVRNGTAPLDVLFTDTSSGNPISWIWDFGDGKTSTIQNVTHQYTNTGTYSVTLLAQNSDYSGSVTMPNAVIVN